eukprot:m.231123 g.231123  ORF g.231123 m.231123 type:complete len:397 (-) comp13896_c1_seq5:1931-3121(-)
MRGASSNHQTREHWPLVSTHTTLSKVDIEEFICKDGVNRLKYVVVDEFDVVFEDTSVSHVWNLLKLAAPHALRKSYLQQQREQLQSKRWNREGKGREGDSDGHKTQVILCGATLPDKGTKSIIATVTSRLASAETIATPALHQPLYRLTQMFDYSLSSSTLRKSMNTTALYNNPSKDRLLSDLEMVFKRNKTRPPSDICDAVSRYLQVCISHHAQVFVFCNTVASTDSLSDELIEQFGDDIETIHKKVHPSDRKEILSAFKQGDIPVICCTDMLARGVDLPVDVVIQANFATDVISYLHRVGRTARNEEKGIAISLVDDTSQDIAVDVEEAVKNIVSKRWLKDEPARDDGSGNNEVDDSGGSDSVVSLGDMFSRNRSRRHRKRKEERNNNNGKRRR